MDLAHLRTVRIETHSAFAKEHNMSRCAQWRCTVAVFMHCVKGVCVCVWGGGATGLRTCFNTNYCTDLHFNARACFWLGRLYSHFVCAKSGDQISKCFRMVVAAVTGIEMTKTEMQRDAVRDAWVSTWQPSCLATCHLFCPRAQAICAKRVITLVLMKCKRVCCTRMAQALH